MKNVRTNADFCALYMKTEQNNFTQKAKKVLTFSVFVIEYISLGSIAQLEKSTGLDVRTFDDALTFKIAMMVYNYMKYLEQ